MAPIYNKSLKQMVFYLIVWLIESIEAMLLKPAWVKK